MLKCVAAAVLLAGTSTSQTRRSDEESILRFVRTFSVLRNAHVGRYVAELYAPDGEWISVDGSSQVRGRPAVTKLWDRVNGLVLRTVESIDFPGRGMAVVRVALEYEGPPVGRYHERFILVKENGRWEIRVHQTLD